MGMVSMDGIVRVTSHLIFIYFTFWAVQGINLETYFYKGKTPQIRAFIIMLAVAIGFLTSSFFLECLTLIRNFILSVV